MTKLYAGVAVAAALAFLGFTAWKAAFDRPTDAFAQCTRGQIAGGDIGGPFTLVNTEGRTVTDKDVLTKPALIYFGYTFCPDFCPMDMARTAEAVDLLAEQGVEVTPVFISVDPDRDTPEVLADYAANLHPNLIALTGSPEQVKAAAQAYRTTYKKHDTGDEFYLVDHMTITYLVLPETGFIDFFRSEITSGEMAESVACFVEASKTGA